MTQLPSLERWALLPFLGFSYPNLLLVFLNLLFLGTCIICFSQVLDFLWVFFILFYFSVPYFGLACDHGNSVLCLEDNNNNDNSHTRAAMSSQLQYRKKGRQTSRHRRLGALHAADMKQLQLFNRSTPFYTLLSDTRPFVNKVAGSGDHGLPVEWQSALSPHDVPRNGCQGCTH